MPGKLGKAVGNGERSSPLRPVVDRFLVLSRPDMLMYSLVVR